MKNMWRLSPIPVVLSVLFILTAVSQAIAQSENEPVGFKNVRLWVNPEYDDPRLLVMLEGQLAGVKPPAKARFLVPSTAEMYSAGSLDAQGVYSGGPPQRKPSTIPDWDEISYVVTTDTFRVEYYYPVIIGQPDKTISYSFRWIYPISDLEVTIQEPRRSSNFRVVPEGVRSTDNQGFPSHLYNFSNLDKDPPIHFDIAYTKADPNPSLAIKSEGSDNSLLLTISVIVGFCIVVGIGLFWVTKLKSKTVGRRKHAGNTIPTPRSKRRQLTAKYCSKCGQSHRWRFSILSVLWNKTTIALSAEARNMPA